MGMRWGKLYKGTPAELALEDAVAELGVPYRTQFPGFMYGFRYFPDFLLPTLGLVIEVDDDSHSKSAKMVADEERTQKLGEFGFQVVRCTNDDALSDPRGTVRAMLKSVGMWPPPKGGKVAGCMPSPGRCPQKDRHRRVAKVRTFSTPATNPTPDPVPPPTPAQPTPFP